MKAPPGNDLTSGSLLHGLVRLAGPMFASAILQNVQTLIDLFWVGRLGSAAVAAVSIAGTVLMLLFPLVMAMAAGTVAFVARYVGAGRHAEASEAAGRSILLALLVGIVAGVAGIPFSRWFCGILGASPAVQESGAGYLAISFVGSFTAFVLFTASSAMQGAGNTVIPMAAMVFANLVNIVLDPLLIFGWLGFPRMGVAGAAVATVISQAVAAGILLLYLRRGVDGLRVRFRHIRLQREAAWRLLQVGMPGGGQMLSRSLMSLVLMRIVAACGMSAVAAYGIGMRFHMIILMPSFALGNAAATLVGQNLGAGQADRARSAAWLATGLACLVTAVSAVIMVAFAPGFMRFFTRHDDVVAIGAAYLRTVSFFYVLAAVAIVLSRALMGAGDTVASMVLTIVCLWGIQVPLAAWLSRRMLPPTQGIWWAVAAALTAHGILIALWFQTGRWKRRKLIE